MKKFIIRALIIVLTVFVPIMLFNYIVDPEQYFRRSNYPYSDVDNWLMQTPGIAKNYPYNSVIIGTSLSANLSSKLLDRLTGPKQINLAIPGSTPKELFLLLESIIKTRKIKSVVWEIQFNLCQNNQEEIRAYFPDYLYWDNQLGTVRYLLTPYFTWQSIKKLDGIIHVKATHKDPYNFLLKGADCYLGKDKLENVKKEFQEETALLKKNTGFYGYGCVRSFDEIKSSVDYNIIEIVKNHKNIRFDFYFPPVSVLYYKAMYSSDKTLFFTKMKVKKYIIEQLRKQPNVALYDFEDDWAVTTKLTNYVDLIHYSPAVSNYVLRSIVYGQRKIPKNVDYSSRIQAFMNYIISFDASKYLVSKRAGRQ